jgi:hypothetical protein
MERICPQCGSASTKLISYMGVDCLVCLSCGYDERDVYNVYPDQKPTELGRKFSPYKTGGHNRAIKK